MLIIWGFCCGRKKSISKQPTRLMCIYHRITFLYIPREVVWYMWFLNYEMLNYSIYRYILIYYIFTSVHIHLYVSPRSSLKMWWRCVWWPALAGPRRMHDVKRQVTAELRPKSEIPRSKIGGKTGSKEKQLQIHQYTSCTFTKISKMVSWMGCNLRILYILLGKHLASKSCVYVCCFLLDAFEAQIWSQAWCGYDRLAWLLMLKHSVLAIFRCNISTRCSCFWKIGVPWSGKIECKLPAWIRYGTKKRIGTFIRDLPKNDFKTTLCSIITEVENLPSRKLILHWAMFHFHDCGTKSSGHQHQKNCIRTVHGEHKRPKWCWWLEWDVFCNGVPQESLSIVFENLISEPLQTYGYCFLVVRLE